MMRLHGKLPRRAIGGIAALLVAGCVTPAPPEGPPRDISEEMLSEAVFSAGWSTRNECDARAIVVSPDANRAIWVQYTDGGYCVVVDGVAGPRFERKFSIWSGFSLSLGDGAFCWAGFSRDSQRVGYSASDGGRFRVVVDGRVESTSDSLTQVQFSSDSRHTAYAIREGESWRVVLDGKAGRAHELVTTNPELLSDGRVVYGARDQKSEILVIGAEETPVDGFVREVATGGGRHACIVQTSDPSGTHVVLVDGIAQGRHERAGSLRFSADGSRLAYAAVDDDRWRVVADGRAGPAFDGLGADSIVWSPDGARLAYSAVADGDWVAVVDDVVHPPRDAAGEPAFEQGDIDRGIVFSPSGARVAWVARDGETSRLIVDGMAFGPPHPLSVDRIGTTDSRRGPAVAFGPDDRHVAFLAAVDGSFGARWTDGFRSRVVIDDAPGGARYVILAPFAFDTPTSVRYVELRQKSLALLSRTPTFTLWRVTETLR